jgi:LysM repeat protein
MDWSLEEIKEINPIYKTAYIPKANPGSCMYGPSEIISRLAGLEDSLYALEESIYFPKKPDPIPVVDTTLQKRDSTLTVINSIKHSVKMGETVKTISVKYAVTVEELMAWNSLSTATLSVGQELVIQQKNSPKVAPVTQIKTTPKVTAPAPKQTNQTTITNPQQNKKPVDTKKYHFVKKGDTFTRIAVNNGLSVQQLKNLNPGVNAGSIYVGQKIRIK